jgi:uncharacterized membrane protein
MYCAENIGYQYILPIMQIHPLSVGSILHIIQVGNIDTIRQKIITSKIIEETFFI